jgi:transposase
VAVLEQPVHPAMMLGVLLYGMIRGVFSSRALAAACRRDMGFIYLSGGSRPSFKTICNFRNSHGASIRSLMVEVLGVLRSAGLAVAGRLVLDSTRARANADRDKMIRADSYDIALRQIDNYLNESRVRDAEEDKAFGAEGDPNVLPPSLRSRKDRLRVLRRAIKDARRHERKAVSPTDVECREMRESGSGKIMPGYALQVGVDKDSGLVTVSDAEAAATDNGFAARAVAQHKANVGALPSSLDADSGYFNAAQLQRLGRRGIDICIPDLDTVAELRGRKRKRPPGGQRIGQRDFEPIDGRDAWRCPGGRELVREGSHRYKGRRYPTYRAVRPCTDCPLASRCLRKSDRGRRRLEVYTVHPFTHHNRKRFKNPEHLARYRRRGGYIERIFGHLRRNLGFRQWLHSGLEKVRTTAALVGMAHNIMVLARVRAAG